MKKILVALDGHKTQIGLVLLALPDILNSLALFLSTLLPLFTDLHVASAVVIITKLVGGITTLVGATDKLRKIVNTYLN